jgi:hypothetical protein
VNQFNADTKNITRAQVNGLYDFGKAWQLLRTNDIPGDKLPYNFDQPLVYHQLCYDQKGYYGEKSNMGLHGLT